MRRGQFMSGRTKAARFEKARKLLNKLKNLSKKKTSLTYFSDENEGGLAPGQPGLQTPSTVM